LDTYQQTIDLLFNKIDEFKNKNDYQWDELTSIITAFTQNNPKQIDQQTRLTLLINNIKEECDSLDKSYEKSKVEIKEKYTLFKKQSQKTLLKTDKNNVVEKNSDLTQVGNAIVTAVGNFWSYLTQTQDDDKKIIEEKKLMEEQKEKKEKEKEKKALELEQLKLKEQHEAWDLEQNKEIEEENKLRVSDKDSFILGEQQEITEEVRDEKNTKLSYAGVFSDLLKKCDVFANQYPNAKNKIIAFIEQTINKDQIADVWRCVTTLDEELTPLNDESICKSLASKN
jgi:hypothetical protein